jgi:hypothetical protein
MFLILGEMKKKIVQKLQSVVKSCEDLLKWWEALEAQFLVVGYLVCQILGIMDN